MAELEKKMDMKGIGLTVFDGFVGAALFFVTKKGIRRLSGHHGHGRKHCHKKQHCEPGPNADVDPEARLVQLGVKLPDVAPKPAACYATSRIVGNLLYTSGHGAQNAEGKWITGKVGKEFDTKQANEIARTTGLHLLSTIREALGGDLRKVKRVVKTLGFVNCPDGFTESPQVIDGCSKLFVEIFGEERGKGVRSAVGTHALPANIPVEIEMVLEIQ